MREAREASAPSHLDSRGFESAPDLQRAFDQAKQAQEPIGPQAAEPEPRTTSAAKSLEGQEQGLSGDTPPVTPQFNQAASDLPKEQDGRGSEMVQADQPAPRPANRSAEAKAVDRAAFNQAWSGEQTKADTALEEARAAAAEARQLENQAAQQRDQDRGMSMG